jgi:type IV secretion system protein VirD4
MDDKFDILRHPNLRGTTDGKAAPFRHGSVTHTVNAALVVDEYTDPARLPEITPPEGDFVLLSEEDVEELYNNKEDDTP